VESSSQKEAECTKEECTEDALKSKEEAEEGGAPPLSRDWTRGSVKRVTRQLEQRMQRQHDCPSAGPPLPPGASCTRRRSQYPPQSPREDDPFGPPAHQDPPPGSFQVLGVGVEQEVEESCNAAQAEADPTEGYALLAADQPLLSTSSPPSPHHHHHHHHHHPSLRYSFAPPLSSVDFLCLEGVTEHDSATDWDHPGNHAYDGDDVVMRETWETLRELGAFLQQVSSHKGGRGIQQRVREVEARIRQAGLTPPSLMKRSASLAKLGCLELLANELSEWDLSPASAVAASSVATAAAAAAGTTIAEPHTVLAASDESKKKQRVHGYPSPPAGRPQACGVGSESLRQPRKARPPPPDLSALQSLGLIAMATRQQYGRTHPLRRLKKRTVSTLYHTM